MYLLVFLSCFGICLCDNMPMDPSMTNIVHLTQDNFFAEIISSYQDLWFVLFTDPDNVDCIDFEPKWSTFSTIIQGFMKTGIVYIKQEKILAERYDIKVVPAIKIFSGNIDKPHKYKGYLNVRSLLHELDTASKFLIHEKMKQHKLYDHEAL